MAVATMKSTVHLAKGESLSRCRITSVMIFLNLLHRITGQTATQLLEYLTVNLRKHHCRVNLTVAQSRQLLKGFAAVLVVVGENGECHQHLICMQTGVLASQIFNLRLLDRFNQTLRNQFCLMIDASQILGGIKQQGCTASKQR